MKNMKNHLSMNLTALRKMNQYTQEEVASRIGVSRQAVAKWENGESAPDVINCNALAEMYNVSLDDLVNYNEKEKDGLAIPPKDKHMFGCVSVGERGQIVIPKKAREIFDIKPGDRLMVLGKISTVRTWYNLLPGKRLFLPVYSFANPYIVK